MRRELSLVVVSLCLFPSRGVQQAPPGWLAVADHAGLDSLVRHSGSFSGWVRGDQDTSVGTLRQSFQADSVRGHRLRFRAFVYTKLDEGTAGLWMRVDGPGVQEVLAFDNMNLRPITGYTPWRPYEVVLDVPAQSSVIAFGLLVEGRGQVWLDDVQLEVVRSAVPSTDMGGGLAQPQAETPLSSSPAEQERILGARRRAPRWPVNLGFEQRP